MRDFGLLPTDIWARIQDLSPATRLIGIYLYAGPHVSILGCYRLPLSYICEDLKIGKRIVQKAVKELAEISFLQFDESSRYFLLNNFLTSRAKKWLGNPNNFKAGTRELEGIPDSVPFREEIRLQLIGIKGRVSNGDTNDVLTPIERRTHKVEVEGEVEVEVKVDRDKEVDAQSADASLESAQPNPLSLVSFASLPKSFSFPLKDSSLLTLDSETVDRWQTQFRHIVVPARLQKQREWLVKNWNRRMNGKGTETWLLKALKEDNEKAATNGAGR